MPTFPQIPFSNVTTAQRLGILGRTLGYVRFSTDDFRWFLSRNFVFLTVLIKSWRGLIWVSAEPLPCTPRLTVTQIVYMQSSTNTQVGFNFPPWSLIFGWFWFSSQPDLWFLVGFDFPPTLIFDFWLVLIFLPVWSLSTIRPALSGQAGWWIGGQVTNGQVKIFKIKRFCFYEFWPIFIFHATFRFKFEATNSISCLTSTPSEVQESF